jgi:hypothetical protein
MPFATVALDSKGRMYVSPTVDRWAIATFDSTGRYTGTIGSKGGGPGEFNDVHAITLTGGDSLVVLHDLNRVTVFDPAGAFARGYGLDAAFIPGQAVVTVDGTMVATRAGAAPGSVDHPAIGFGADGSRVRSYGEATVHMRGPNYSALAVDGDQIWAADGTIAVYGYGPTGAVVLHHRDWYDTAGQAASGKRWRFSRVRDMAVHREGELWVLGWRRQAQQRPNSPQAPVAETPATSLSLADATNITEQFLDLIDTGRGELVARAKLGKTVAGGLLGGDLLYTFAEDRDGETEIRIWRVHLCRDGGSDECSGLSPAPAS